MWLFLNKQFKIGLYLYWKVNCYKRTMFPLLKGVVNVLGRCSIFANKHFTSSFHILAKPSVPSPNNTKIQQFLVPSVYNLVPYCGFKVKGRVKRRCKDCFMVWREGRLYNLCKTHGRHKQMSIVKDVRNTWILTHATQSKVRPW